MKSIYKEHPRYSDGREAGEAISLTVSAEQDQFRHRGRLPTCVPTPVLLNSVLFFFFFFFGVRNSFQNLMKVLHCFPLKFTCAFCKEPQRVRGPRKREPLLSGARLLS